MKLNCCYLVNLLLQYSLVEKKDSILLEHTKNLTKESLTDKFMIYSSYRELHQLLT